jgi:muramoyltetrapeptide carboxypeptidase
MSHATRAPAALPMPVLTPGARIYAVAPSSPFPRDEFERGVQRLQQRYQVRFDPAIFTRSGYLAGDDARRLGELHAALHDDSVDAIVAARGGYGAARLLDRVDVASIARKPKLLVGFSDVTALHALWARAGVGSLHGMMLAALGRAGDARVQQWIAAVEGALPAPLTGLRSIGALRARASGILVGGNLAVLTALIGTPYLPPLDGCVLFLEDVGERPYRVDRMLTTWQLAGLLHTPAAIVLGGFHDCAPNADGVTIDDVLHERLGALDVPVLAGVPVGHGDDSRELPLGARVHVDAARGSLTFEARDP